MGDDGTIRLGWDDSKVDKGRDKMVGGMKKAGEEIKHSFAGVREHLAGTFAAVTAANIATGVVGHLIDFGREAINTSKRMLELSETTNYSTDSLQRLGYMSEGAGGDLETTLSTLVRMNRELGSTEDDGALLQTFEKLGINTRDFVALDPDRQVILLSQAFQKAREEGGGLQELFDIFGKKFETLLPLLTKPISFFDKQANKEIISEEDIVAAANRIKTVKGLISSLKNEITTGLGHSMGGAVGSKEDQAEIDRRYKERAAARHALQEKVATAKTTPTTEQKKLADEERKRQEILQTLREDMHVLALRQGGQNKMADALENELKLKREAKKLSEETNLDEQQALKLLREKQGLENGIKNNGERAGRIHGYDWHKDPNHPLNRRSGSGLDYLLGHGLSGGSNFSGLDEWKRMQEYRTDPATGRPLRAYPVGGGGHPLSDDIIPGRQHRNMQPYERPDAHKLNFNQTQQAIVDRLDRVIDALTH